MLTTSLRYFMAVVRLRSIRAASGQLHVAQSAVSRQSQALEHRVGAILFERQSDGVVPTQAGRLLYEFGRKAEFDADELRSELDSLRGLRRGHVRVAAIESMIPNVLPQAIGRFRARHEGITFAVQAATSEPIVEMVRDGSADIGIGLSTRLGPDFRVISSTREPLMAVAGATHPLAALDRAGLHDLTGWAVALAPPPAASRSIFDEAYRAANIRIAPILETNSVELMQRFAILGHGVALLLRHTVAGALRDGQLRQLAFDEQLLGGTIDIFTFQDRTLPVAVEAFIQVLKDAVGA